MKIKLTALLAIAVALSACSAAATVASNPDAQSKGVEVKALGAGKLNSLPTGPVYIRMIRFAQEPGYGHSRSAQPVVYATLVVPSGSVFRIETDPPSCA